jgi:integrase
MDAGVDVGIIASLMGHKSPRETGVYMHALSKGKESAIDTISFKNNKEDKEQ